VGWAGWTWCAVLAEGAGDGAGNTVGRALCVAQIDPWLLLLRFHESCFPGTVLLGSLRQAMATRWQPCTRACYPGRCHCLTKGA